MSYPYVDILTAPYVYYASFNAVECFKMHCNVSQKLVTHLQRFPWMRATLSNDEEWFSNEAWISSDCFESLATFSNEDENEDEDWYDRLGPGTRTSSTAVFRRETGLNNVLRMSVTSLVYLSSPCAKHSGKVKFLQDHFIFDHPNSYLRMPTKEKFYEYVRNATHGKKCYVIQGSRKMFLTVPAKVFHCFDADRQ